MKKLKRIYYLPGFISLLLLFPSFYIYLDSVEATKPKTGFIVGIYKSEPIEAEYVCAERTVPLNKPTIYRNNKLDLTQLYDIKNKFIKGEVEGDPLPILLPELHTYNDFISILNVFAEMNPYCLYYSNENAILIYTMKRTFTDDDITLFGYMRRPVIYEEKSYKEIFTSSINNLQFCLPTNATGIIILLFWAVIAFAGILNYKKFLQRPH